MLKVGNKNYKIAYHSHSFSIEPNAITPKKKKNMIFFFLNRNHAGMQNDELKGGGRTHTKCGPAGLHIIFARFTFGNSSCGGRTYPAPSGTHNIEISILEPISISISISVSDQDNEGINVFCIYLALWRGEHGLASSRQSSNSLNSPSLHTLLRPVT